MLHRAFAGVAASMFLAMGFDGQAATPRPATGNSAQNCAVSVAQAWVIPATATTRATRLRVEAFSNGPTCAKAVVVYVIRDASATVLFHEAYQSEFVATTAEARTPAQMRAALTEWTSTGTARQFHASLPNWLAGASAPVQTEFPFMPDEGITRQDYLAIKAARTPALCYVQGMESLNCVIYRNGKVEPFGLQSFPG